MTPPGKWAWWHDGPDIVVGWMVPEQFGDEDIPAYTVPNVRDALIAVDFLTYLRAGPIGG